MLRGCDTGFSCAGLVARRQAACGKYVVGSTHRIVGEGGSFSEERDRSSAAGIGGDARSSQLRRPWVRVPSVFGCAQGSRGSPVIDMVRARCRPEPCSHPCKAEQRRGWPLYICATWIRDPKRHGTCCDKCRKARLPCVPGSFCHAIAELRQAISRESLGQVAFRTMPSRSLDSAP